MPTDPLESRYFQRPKPIPNGFRRPRTGKHAFQQQSRKTRN